MALLNDKELASICKQFGAINVIRWEIEEFPDKVIGYLGDHLKLKIVTDRDGKREELKLFVKCMPRFDQWKAEYLRELNFFYKEFVMLSKLFREFHNGEGSEKWRPKLLFIREDLFVFEDVSQLGYIMPYHRDYLSHPTLKATVKTLARFHAQSFIYEEIKSKELGKPYRIWDEFSQYLQEPIKGQSWRDAGRNAVIDFLKHFSKYKSRPDFSTKVEYVLTELYNSALTLMKPSDVYRNVVIHRDLWTNNIFIKEGQSVEPHALMVDFQTVLYASPMLDLSSLFYFNTERSWRDAHCVELIDFYYETLSDILLEAGLNVERIFPKKVLMKSYNDSLIFGMTQAALIVPIIAMDANKREEIFCDPERNVKANVVSRSDEFIEIAKEDSEYYNRLCDLFDEIVERLVYNTEETAAKLPFKLMKS